MSKEVLASTLRRFYATVRQKKTNGTEGKQYTKQSHVNIRSALNRHLQYPPYKTWDLIHNNEFKPANKVFQVKKKYNKTHTDQLFKMLKQTIIFFLNTHVSYFFILGNFIIQKAKGMDQSKPHRPILQEHLFQIYEMYFDDHFDNDPRCL